MENIFTVTHDNLANLGLQKSIELFRDLVWAEMRRCGIPQSCFHISVRFGLTDAGIDANLTDMNIPSDSSILRWRNVGFQIKSGSSFKPNSSSIQEELFGEENGRPKHAILANLKPAIKNVLDAGGAYVLVCFGWEGVQDKAVNVIRGFLAQFYSGIDIEVWNQSAIIGQLQAFPSLALRANKRELNLFIQTYKSWSKNGDMAGEFIGDENNLNCIETIRNIIRNRNSAEHIRIIGEPGIGKTRLALEATKEDDLNPLILYCKTPDNFKIGGLHSSSIIEDNTSNVILVIDECQYNEAKFFWNILHDRGLHICLITINDYDREKLLERHNSKYIQIERLSDKAIERILLNCSVPNIEAQHWAGQCDGSPSVAYIIAGNYTREVDIQTGLSEIWNRYITKDSENDNIERRISILRYLALFRRFGYREPVDNEAKFIFESINKAFGYTENAISETIKKLINIGILQGGHTLHITPSLLHIYLWAEYWHYYSSNFDYKKFTENMPTQLEIWFEEMFKYANLSKAASNVVSKLLTMVNGPFSKEYYTENDNGANFFSLLAEASPEEALKLLEDTILTRDKESLQKYTTGRRYVVWALQKIAVWKDLMIRAARILLALAEAENENMSNNATGVFAGLFNIVNSATEKPFLERLDLLKEALKSESKEKRMVALKALQSALNTHTIFRIVGPEYQGLRKTPKLWLPETIEEMNNCYARTLEIFISNLKFLSDSERPFAIEILLGNARGLILFPELSEKIIEYLNYIADNPDNKLKRLLEVILDILHYDSPRLSEDIKNKLELLRDRLTGDSFHSLLKRHVGTRLFIDSIMHGGQFGDASQPALQQLAKESVSDVSLLEAELGWLVTKEAENGYKFGFELSKLDNECKILPKIIVKMIDAKESATAYFLSGYFKSIYDGNLDTWEQMLDELAKDSKTREWVPEITWRCGLTERAAQRIIDIFCDDESLISYSNLFIYGGEIKKISEDLFNKWLSLLIDGKDNKYWATVISLFCLYYIHEPNEHEYNKDFACKILFSEITIDLLINRSGNPMTEFEWGEAAKKFIKDYPEKIEDIALIIFNRISDIFKFPHVFKELMLQMVKTKPTDLWSVLTSFIKPPYDERYFIIKDLLRGESYFGMDFSPSFLEFFSPDMIWEWVGKDVPNHAKFLASVVPPIFFRKEGKVCLARELLVRYGNISEVRNNLCANFGTEGWKGPASEYFQNKKEKLEIFLSDEENQNVKKWLNDYITDLEQTIKNAVINEERRGF